MNKHRYKALSEQTIVITGATSGIGLATTQRAAKAGSKLVLAARNEDALQKICAEITEAGGQAVYVVADVGNEEDIQSIADKAIAEFDGFDTWVNNAGVLVYSDLKDLPNDEHKRIFETNYWGVVNGSMTAQKHFKTRPDGGTLINIASINAQMPVPILGAYSASKAAVKAYSDVLRMELDHENAPVRVTVVMPSGISTPISEHGRSNMRDRGKVMPPLYDPEVVANAILTAAQKRVRQITVGGSGKASTVAWHLFPSFMDKVLGWAMPKAQSTGKTKSPTDNLFSPDHDGDIYLDGKKHGIPVSPYTYGRLHPSVPLGLGIVAAAIYLATTKKKKRYK